jgi:alpha-1,2-mannosyltransferase
MTAADTAVTGAPPDPADRRLAARRSRLLLIAGITVFAAAAAIYLQYLLSHPMRDWMSPVDLRVYRFGGMIAAHVRPWYNPARRSPLYDWPGFNKLKFTYTPFAALAFAVLALPPLHVLLGISIVVNAAALLGTIWVTLGGIGCRASLARLGGTLLLGGVLLWVEPVQRTLFLGQIELVLMALIMWDMCQPDSRKWKGAGIGIAAGIKLVPLIFIPYLLLTRRYRQAAVAGGVFAATVLIGFAAAPADSVRWWFDGVFAQGSRTGFIGWEGNQSLQALITRLSGSIAAGQPIWLAAAAVTLVAGLAAAMLLDRAGRGSPSPVTRSGWRMAGLLTCALTGLLISPISWDHHWVWVVPAATALAGLAVRAGARAASLVALGLAGLLAVIFGAWPGSLWGEPRDMGTFSLGFIWAPPNTNPATYDKRGDQPSYVEYHWHGLQLLAGNLYILTGLAAFVALAVAAVLTARARRPRSTA